MDSSTILKVKRRRLEEAAPALVVSLKRHKPATDAENSIEEALFRYSGSIKTNKSEDAVTQIEHLLKVSSTVNGAHKAHDSQVTPAATSHNDATIACSGESSVRGRKRHKKVSLHNKRFDLLTSVVKTHHLERSDTALSNGNTAGINSVVRIIDVALPDHQDARNITGSGLQVGDSREVVLSSCQPPGETSDVLPSVANCHPDYFSDLNAVSSGAASAIPSHNYTPTELLLRKNRAADKVEDTKSSSYLSCKSTTASAIKPLVDYPIDICSEDSSDYDIDELNDFDPQSPLCFQHSVTQECNPKDSGISAPRKAPLVSFGSGSSKTPTPSFDQVTPKRSTFIEQSVFGWTPPTQPGKSSPVESEKHTSLMTVANGSSDANGNMDLYTGLINGDSHKTSSLPPIQKPDKTRYVKANSASKTSDLSGDEFVFDLYVHEPPSCKSAEKPDAGHFPAQQSAASQQSRKRPATTTVSSESSPLLHGSAIFNGNNVTSQSHRHSTTSKCQKLKLDSDTEPSFDWTTTRVSTLAPVSNGTSSHTTTKQSGPQSHQLGTDISLEDQGTVGAVNWVGSGIMGAASHDVINIRFVSDFDDTRMTSTTLTAHEPFYWPDDPFEILAWGGGAYQDLDDDDDVDERLVSDVGSHRYYADSGLQWHHRSNALWSGNACGRSDDEDSNAEDNWRNDYPEEDSDYEMEFGGCHSRNETSSDNEELGYGEESDSKFFAMLRELELNDNYFTGAGRKPKTTKRSVPKHAVTNTAAELSSDNDD